MGGWAAGRARGAGEAPVLTQLGIGTGMICLAVMIQAIFIAIAVGVQRRYPIHALPGANRALVLTVATLWMILGQTAIVWIWAALFLHLGAFTTLETSVYFALVAFTTLGFGDVLIGPDWRLLGGLTATNGMIAFGLTTAFLLDVMERLRRSP